MVSDLTPASATFLAARGKHTACKREAVTGAQGCIVWMRTGVHTDLEAQSFAADDEDVGLAHLLHGVGAQDVAGGTRHPSTGLVSRIGPRAWQGGGVGVGSEGEGAQAQAHSFSSVLLLPSPVRATTYSWRE